MDSQSPLLPSQVDKKYFDEIMRKLLGWPTNDQFPFLMLTAEGEYTWTLEEDITYTGQVSDARGTPDGWGRLQWSGKGIFSGKSYTFEGQWKNGVVNGKGLYITGRGDTYMGEWLQNRFHGFGVY